MPFRLRPNAYHAGSGDALAPVLALTCGVLSFGCPRSIRGIALLRLGDLPRAIITVFLFILILINVNASPFQL